MGSAHGGSCLPKELGEEPLAAQTRCMLFSAVPIVCRQNRHLVFQPYTADTVWISLRYASPMPLAEDLLLISQGSPPWRDYESSASDGALARQVEGQLFAALKKTCLVQSRETSNYSRCARTDKGVSALGQVSNHPEFELRANCRSISHRCRLFEVACVRELTGETIHVPLGCLPSGNPQL